MVDKAIILFLLVTIVCLGALTVYVIKLLISLKDLANNANIIATSVQKEIEPTLQELKEAAKSINSIANNADAKFKNAKTGIASALGLSACLGGRLKDFIQGIAKGISFGVNMFKK